MKTAAKDFKMTELGPIPKDWEVKRLGEIWKRFATGPFGSSLHASDYVSGGTPLVNPMHIVEGKIIPDKEMTVDCVTRKRLASYKLNAGDLVMGRRGEMGRVAVVTKKEQGWLCGTGSFTITLRDNESPDFVARYLRTPQCVAEMTNEAVGTTIQNLNQTLVSQINIAYPPLPEQRKISAALSDVDEMIAALEKLIEKKRKIKTGAMQRLLTGKTRLPGFKGAWVEKRLGEAFEFHSNNTFSRASMIEGRGQIYNIHYGDVLIRYGAVLDCNKTAIPSLDDAASSVCKRDFLKDGDVIIADTAEDETVGKAVEVINVGDRLIASGLHTIFLRPKEGAFALGWLGYYVNSTAFHDQLLPLITGIKVSSISKGSLMDAVLRCPSTLAEQKAIAKVLGDMDEEIAALEAELAKTRQLKQGMMQELLTGKVRLG